MTITQASEQLKSLAGGLSRKQRIVLVVSAILVAATVAIFVRLVAKPQYSVLYSGLDPNEGRSISRRLAGQDVPYELSSDATSISVPADRLDKVRLQLAEEGLPHTGQLGFELFDKPDWGSSDFVEQVNYERALEGELERTIETIDGVQSARVHLVLPQQTLFSSQEQPAKAAVVLHMRSGRLSEATLFGIQNLVASAVRDLKPNAVSVIDSNGQMPDSDPTTGGMGAQPMEAQLDQKILDTLAPIVGTKHVRADVNVQFNLGTTENTQESYDPKASAVLSYQRSGNFSDAAAANSNAAGVPGTTSNVPNVQGPGTSLSSQLGISNSSGGGGDQTESQTFAVSRSVSHTVSPAGTIKRVTAAVLIDDQTKTTTQNGKTVTIRQPLTPDQLQQVRALVMAAVGFDPNRGDQVVVENMPFEQAPVPVTPHGLMERWTPGLKTLQSQTPDLLRYGALGILFVVLYLLVLRPLRDQLVETMKNAHLRPSLPAATASDLPSFEQSLGLGLSGGHGGNSLLSGGLDQPMLPISGSDAIRQDPVEMEAQLVRELNQTSSEVKRAVLLKKHLADKVKREPMTAGRLVHNWIRQRDDRR